MRVVADTNVYISALLFGGLPGKFLDQAFHGDFRLVTSPVLLEELEEKLRVKFDVSPEDVRSIRARLEKRAQVVRPTVNLHIVHDDPDDDRVLECAAAGNADRIVSGDRHLLKLTAFEAIPIQTVRQFMDALP